jgi:CheY-like chemotaxis protein
MLRTVDILNARILIVDDQESHVLLLDRILRDAGYASVESTMDPTAVCALHRKNRYAAILLDLKMPGMDGFQVMDQLKEVEGDGNLPVLVITAEPGHKLRALRAGARDFVSKPLDLPEVLIRVHNMIEIRLLRLETERLRASLSTLKRVLPNLPSL